MVAMADLVQVWASYDAVEAALIRGSLEAEEIPVLVKGEGTGPYRVGPVYLFVAEGDELRARVLIDALRSGEYSVDGDVEAADVADGS